MGDEVILPCRVVHAVTCEKQHASVARSNLGAQPDEAIDHLAACRLTICEQPDIDRIVRLAKLFPHCRSEVGGIFGGQAQVINILAGVI